MIKTKNYKATTYALFIVLLFHNLLCFSQTEIGNLKVEYQKEPLGIDIEKPQFSWQMIAIDEARNQYQTAYRLVVKSENDEIVWDTENVISDESLAIQYNGKPLKSSTRYNWTVSVWNQDQKEIKSSSWFETGLLNPDSNLSAWNGAKWIGGTAEDIPFNSHYLSVFKVHYELQLDEKSKSTKAAFVFGGNDSRLMDHNKNIQGVESKVNGNYIAFELDIENIDGTPEGLAKFNVYRVGYDKADTKDIPFRSFDIPLQLINIENKYASHEFNVESNFGIFEVFLNGQKNENKIVRTENPSPSPYANNGMNLNPVGKGNDYICFPVVGDIGFSIEKKQKAYFTNFQIKNYRSPSNNLFLEELDEDYKGIFKNIPIKNESYFLDGRKEGLLLLKNPSKNSTPILRTTFSTNNKKISKARLYVTARGIYEMYLNGERISEDYFNPGLTQYNKTHMYQTYDVTNKIQNNSSNSIGAMLGEGWWSGNITYSGEHWNYFGDRQSLLTQLIITYEDGSEQIVVSKPKTWNYFNNGPIVTGSYFQGEVYDARKEKGIEGWATAAYDDHSWKSAVEIPIEGTTFLESSTDLSGTPTNFNYDDLQLIGQIGKNVQIVKTLSAQSVEEVRPGVFVYDMGQNMVGFPNISLGKGQKNDTVTLRYAEVKYPDLSEYKDNVGMIMLENIRAALTQDLYIRKGQLNEVIQPIFTFHGYRFLEITGINEPLPLEAVKGKVLSSINGLASSYETSNELVNKLWENITWSMRGNFLSIPTDTPARNERMGWSGDINVFSKAATYIANANPFLKRHMMAMRDIQAKNGRFTDVAPVGGGFGGTLWGSAGIIVAWETYRQYGDKQLLREHYPAMKKYIAFLASKENEEGVIEEGPLGDWLSPEGKKNDNTLLWNAYQVYDLEIVSKIATLLGYSEDAIKFKEAYTKRKAFFNKTYVHQTSKKTIGTGRESFSFGPPLPAEKKPKPGDLVDSQASYAIPLALNVVDDGSKVKFAEHLAHTISRKNIDDSGMERPAYSLMTGFIGTASISEALSQNNYNAHAYRLLQQEQYPSWLYSVKNGATTIWERLNSYTVENGFGGNNSMNSFNHYSFGAVAAWMNNYSLGIQRHEKKPAFKEFILQPTPDPDGVMTWAKGHYDSMYGTIKSEWKQVDGTLYYVATVPANTKATLYLPSDSLKKITESGKKVKKSKGVKFLGKEEDKLIFHLKSGTYEFEIKK
ncbi:alpha-L-rhamnosidase [Saonia flava]|uniref:alpha-L-rhamnosidase n=1 Tax=Saonia flava TaxID=523696 RepID=A0A846QMH7_9FLAO|nr:alpha-L-rhamnosidase [Saonia flava]NJB70196.1 alpha-L-rhamnosidase [Saonia flava]